MLASLRKRLTWWFVCLSMLLYTLGSAFALVVFDRGLTNSLDGELRGLYVEIRPSIEFKNGTPTLAAWAKHLVQERLSLPATIQLFDRRARLVEQYGPEGVPRLGRGTLSEQVGGAAVTVRSYYWQLEEGGRVFGTLQIQVPTRLRDDAMREYGLALMIIAPLLAAGLGVCGYFFSGKAVQPVEQSVQLLRRFVADAGHELNTPITVIEASVETLTDTFEEKRIPTDVLEVIARASARMKDLAANLMLLARMESPELMTPRVALSVREVVEPVVEDFVELARGKHIELNLSAIPPLMLNGHRESLRRMLSNLLDNALRYTDPGGSVTVGVGGEDTDVVITVEDTGIGIPRESLSHVFDRFYRVDKSRSRSQGGSGLGLSIVRAIVDAHKGAIVAESEPGKGTKFVVTLPGRV